MSTSVDDNSRLRPHSLPVQFVAVNSLSQIATVAALAKDIWYEHYVPLIGRPQVDYMVSKFQTVSAIEAQIRGGYEYFLATRNAEPGGYLAVHEQNAERRMFISKLYVTKGIRGTGTGRACMEFIEQTARARGLSRLWLTVSKRNPAVHAYQRLGFRIAEAIVMDIGGGFVMDDFRMERELT